MKNKLFTKFVPLIALLLASQQSFAQLDFLPQGSQRAVVTQRLGITNISIDYSRPKVNERSIWGSIVPYSTEANEIPWRAGANTNTVINIPDNATIEGQPLAAGSYGLHMLVHENNEITVIFNKVSTSWGSFNYDKAEDALRVKVKSKESAHHELLTFEFIDTHATSTTAALLWEAKEIPFKIELPVSDLVMEKIKEELLGIKGFSRQNWEQAANYAFTTGELEQAEVWIDNAIEGRFFSAKSVQNLGTKALILSAKGEQEASNLVLNEALAMGNMNDLNNLGYQLLFQNNFEGALMAFKLNVKNNPDNANVHDSLGEAYKISGDKENAIKHLKKSLSLDPAANVKANSIKLLNELGVKVSEK